MSGLTGQKFASVQNKTLSTHLIISGNHHKHSELFVFESPITQLILGFPWLREHNPMINWAEKQIEQGNPHCLQDCLRIAVPSVTKHIEAPDNIDSSKVPTFYLDLTPVFTNNGPYLYHHTGLMSVRLICARGALFPLVASITFLVQSGNL